MEIQSIPGFTQPVSSLTHLLGALVFAGLTPRLWHRSSRWQPRWTTLVFSFTAVFLLSMSGVYHLLALEGTAHRVLQRLDHAAIFALIAGSFTPLQPGFFHSPLGRWGVLLLIWTLAVLGMVLKVVFFDAIPETVSVTIYLALGWLGLGSGIALGRRFGFAFIRPLVGGGLAYTLGAIADFARWPILISGVVGPHEIMHLAVLAGISAFWWFFFTRLPSEASPKDQANPPCV